MCRRCWILAAWLVVVPASAHANVLMLVEGVPGTAALKDYGGWFPIESLQWAIDRSSGAASQTLDVRLRVSAGVATLRQSAASGSPFKRIVFDHLGNSGLRSRLTCEDALIRSFDVGWSMNESLQGLRMQCARLVWEEVDRDAGGAIIRSGKGSWNFRTNTP